MRFPLSGEFPAKGKKISNRPGHGFRRLRVVPILVDAILTSRQTREKLQCLYENLMSNNFRRTAVLKKISIVN